MLTRDDLEAIRRIVREEIQRALEPAALGSPPVVRSLDPAPPDDVDPKLAELIERMMWRPNAETDRLMHARALSKARSKLEKARSVNDLRGIKNSERKIAKLEREGPQRFIPRSRKPVVRKP